MEAVYKTPLPVVNCSSAVSRYLNLLHKTSLECSLGRGFVRQHLAHKPRTLLSKRLNRTKPGGQIWGLDFRSEATAGVEDSIPEKGNADIVRNTVEVVASGGHCSNLNGYPIVGDAANGEIANGDVANEVRHALTGDASCAVVTNSVNGGSHNGSVNGSTVKRTSRNGSANGHATYSGIPPLNGSSNGAVVNGASIYAGQGNTVNIHSVNGILANSRAANAMSKNGALHEYSKAPTADGSVTMVPELERLVQAPLNVPSKQAENDGMMERMPHFEDPLVFATGLAPLQTKSTATVEDEISLIMGDAARQKSSDADTSGGLGILKFLKGKNLLVTGATGFLAKVMVEKILRVQPDVGQLYLLIQPQKNVTAEERLKNNVISSPLFSVLKDSFGDAYEEFMNNKLTAVSGTISADGLGIANDKAEEISKTVHIIVNSAATTTFDERYDIALNVNTQGPRRIIEFARGCPNLQLFLHVSTAFVNGQRRGDTPEKPFRMGDSIAKEMSEDCIPDLHVASELALCAKTLQEVVAEVSRTSVSASEQQLIVDKKMKELGMTRAKLFGWQDTYVFSKAMGEMLVESLRGEIPVVVLRPSVVESTLAQPFPGWMEGIRMMDPIVLAYAKGQMTGFLADPRGVLDVIPADLVVNALLAAMTKHAQNPGLQVYQVASSVVNPMTFELLADVALELFTKDPMIDRAGQPVKLQRMRFVQSMTAFNLYLWFVYQLPLKLSKILPWMKRGKSSARRELIVKKTLEQFKYLAYIYKPYTFYAGRFGIENTESLSQELSEEELNMFAFNIRQIDWADYLSNVHIPGLRNYVLKGRGTRN
uniref:Fatty acyl-CoA reductase n=1 Tax=Physcomitrium patens TaxID=3218 RepID=A0A2K1KA26_PHYPA|nr:fatty acyl-CoA reductase 2-like [Physcomitrium patens]PNR50630.1 hypothetical protein PHYPA_009816 [Physcomitrium patens]|eukprot:XP_024380705.1 fatty acyl-CoA reductase 2-like [Physcomitrella patens]